MTMTEKTTPIRRPRRRRPATRTNWAKPVDRLSAEGVAGAKVDTVTGKRVSGPLQGFGQLWQKTFTRPLDGSTMSPQEVIAIWKERFPTFWPKRATFYAPLAGIAPGEVALLDIAPVPGSPVKLSTGVMVLYADDESFTFMTPEGHTLSAWITFSAYRDGDVTVAQAQALERTVRPVRRARPTCSARNRMNNRFWRRRSKTWPGTSGSRPRPSRPRSSASTSAASGGTPRNVRNSATLRAAGHTLTAPVRWIARRG